MKDYLSKNLNHFLPRKHLYHFNLISSDGFTTKHFLVGLTTLTIVGDDIGTLQYFWSSVNIQFTVSNKPNIQYLSSNNKLSLNICLYDHVYPLVSYNDYCNIKGFLDYIRTLMHNVMEPPLLAQPY